MKAFDLPISRNPLKTRDDLTLSLEQLLEPLLPRYINGGAGIHAGNSGAIYEGRTAAMEGWSRVLWGLVPWLAGRADSQVTSGATSGAAVSGTTTGSLSKILELELAGLRAGTDPDSPYFWGVPTGIDQREVEMAAMALAILLTPDTFWNPLSDKEKDNFVTWVSVINRVTLPRNNWEFFRILVNLALKSVGREYDKDMLQKGLDFVESQYAGDGWYSDDGSFDYYNPFAFHYYGMVYAKLMKDEDPERCERYRERARQFARQFLPWFAADGSCVPMGRSLTYRFAVVSFFSACAFADEEVLPWGVMKGTVLRNLRWWFSQAMFDHEGLMTVGYSYPSLVMAEQYNSPTSAYWSLKTYVLLAVDAAHPFWTAEEQAFPVTAIPAQIHQPVPHFHICRVPADDHVQLFTAGQYPVSEHVNLASKYAKFVYSTKYGFSASHASYAIEKTGCDSTLLLSEGDGYWRERRKSLDRASTQNYLYSRWLPWKDVEVRTWIVPLMPWHVRIHLIDSARELESVEGGFSVSMENGFEPQLEPILYSEATPGLGGLTARAAPRSIEIVALGAHGFAALVRNDTAGVVSSLPILDLTGSGRQPVALPRSGDQQRSEPNLNILFNRTLVPVLKTAVPRGRSLLVAAVYAGAKLTETIAKNQPTVSFDARDGSLLVSNLDAQVRLPFGL